MQINIPLMKKFFSLLFVLMVLTIHGNIYAQSNNIQRYIDRLMRDTLFTDAVVGIMVMDSDGRTVASWNPDMPLLTASTMKTITTGIALTVLGDEYRFSTRLGHTGFIENGTLYGDLYIVGGGDPTLGSRDTLAVPVDTLFSQWHQYVSAAGINRINGSIVADDRFFEPEIIPESWSWSNIGTSFGNGPSGLSFLENLQYFKFIPGSNIGDKVFLHSVFPEVPDMEYRNNLVTAGSRTGDRSSYYISDLSRVGSFSGTLPTARDTISITVSNKFPQISCAYEFREYLARNGVLSENTVKSVRDFEAAPEEELKIIGVTLSPSLTSIVNVTNRISNNFYAETLFKTVGKVITMHGSYDSSAVAAAKILTEMGLKTRGYTQVDGSGLSRQDYVSPRFFCNYFTAMKESPYFDIFFNSLPQPGHPGTLQNVLSRVNIKDKSRIHAKSGSLANVRCYAGYVESHSGKNMLTFAIMTNNYSAKTAQMQVGIEEFMKQLIEF